MQRKRKNYTALLLFIPVLCAVFIKCNLINRDLIRTLDIRYATLVELSEAADKYKIELSELIVLYAFEHSASDSGDVITNYKLLKKKYSQQRIDKYASVLKTVFSEVKTFPIESISDCMYGDVWRYKISYAGTDIVSREMKSLSVVSMTDGTVDAVGLNRYLNFYVSIKTTNGTRYYYGHLENVKLTKGMKITAGQLIGYMKSKTDKLPEIRICVSPIVNGKSIFINPYLFLRMVERKSSL